METRNCGAPRRGSAGRKGLRITSEVIHGILYHLGTPRQQERIFPLVPFWKLRIEEGRVHALQESASCRPVKKAWPLRQRGMPGKKITRRRRVRRGIAEACESVAGTCSSALPSGLRLFLFRVPTLDLRGWGFFSEMQHPLASPPPNERRHNHVILNGVRAVKNLSSPGLFLVSRPRFARADFLRT
jgi:hypothetical protein